MTRVLTIALLTAAFLVPAAAANAGPGKDIVPVHPCFKAPCPLVPTALTPATALTPRFAPPTR